MLCYYYILSTYQSGRRSNDPTSILTQTSDALCASDVGQLIDGSFSDLNKALDSVDPFLLLEQLSDILKWQSFGSIHTIIIENNVLQRGVPQGLTLGPLFFSVYTNKILIIVSIQVLLVQPECLGAVYLLSNSSSDWRLSSVWLQYPPRMSLSLQSAEQRKSQYHQFWYQTSICYLV